MIMQRLPRRSSGRALRLHMHAAQRSIGAHVTAFACASVNQYPSHPSHVVAARLFSSSSMDAFMEFEREMAKKRFQSNPRPIVARRERPVPPKDDECCKLDCPNCVLLVYQEKLLEYEMSMQQGQDVIKPERPETKFTITFLEAEPNPEQHEQLRRNDNLLYQVTRNELISQPHKTKDNYVRSVRHIDLAVGEHQHNQITDDASNIAVFVPNDASVVDRVLAHLKIDPDLVFTVAPACAPSHPVSEITLTRPFAEIGSVRDALTWSLDVVSTPRISFLRQLASYAEDANDVAALLAPNASELIQASRPDQRITVADIFDMFPSVRLDFASFYQFAPLNAPRYYTVSSSRHLYPETVSITLGLRKLESQPTPRCSSYLSALSSNVDYVRATFFKSSFLFPRADRRPVMLISAGTGIAPFRAFLQDLEHEQAASIESNHREAYLFYGCRHRKLDYLYGDDIEHAREQGYLDGLFVEFSGTPAQPKRYVQDALAEQGALVARHLVSQQGYIFICGSLQMGRAAKQAIVQALREHSHFDESEAKDFLTQCLVQQRVVTELW